MKILVCDDSATVREFWKVCLEGYGEVDYAQNGAEAIELIDNAYQQNEPYELACLDIIMPEVNGYDVLAHIRMVEEEHKGENLPPCKIIMATGKDQPQDFTAAYMIGCEAYITKPLNKEKVLSEIKSLGFCSCN